MELKGKLICATESTPDADFLRSSQSLKSFLMQKSIFKVETDPDAYQRFYRYRK